MKSALTVDSAGRIVLPSEARRLLNLRPGSRLRLTIVAERIELTPEPQTEQAPSTSPTGRQVLSPTGTPTDASAATRAERTLQSRTRRGR
jgi:AbrB family looped-hinge helix DNA binding protein